MSIEKMIQLHPDVGDDFNPAIATAARRGATMCRKCAEDCRKALATIH